MNMVAIQNKVDFALIIGVNGANPNGDPLNGNRPRQTVDGLGEISDVCIKRKIRNRIQDFGVEIFVKSDDRSDDGFKSLKERANEIIKQHGKDRESFAKVACDKWYDVRAFGQVFAIKSGENDSLSYGVRGPVSIRPAFSISPINITSLQITKSVNSLPGDKKGSDTMGMKHRVDFGIYLLCGSINVQLAQKTGFSDEDAELLKTALSTLFENDCSSARPDGSMDIIKMIWWKHNCASGQYSSAKVHNSVKIIPKCNQPNSAEDYEIKIENLDGLTGEIIL